MTKSRFYKVALYKKAAIFKVPLGKMNIFHIQYLIKIPVAHVCDRYIFTA